ncbi:hypothetical protein JW905_04620, partial [bacterium]|nr:hypothetical protein [candidate division CSSED10-310 bacterium]
MTIMGGCWVRLAAGTREPAPPAERHGTVTSAALLLLLATATLTINLGALHNVVPAQGDEIFHVMRLRELRGILLTPSGFVTFGIAAGCLLLAVRTALPAPVTFLVTAAGFMLAAGFTSLFHSPGLDYFLMRYPFLSIWFHQVGPVWNAMKLYEASFRVVPLAAAIGLGWFLLSGLRRETGGLTALGAGLCVVTIPTVHYHATILYLELPAVLLLTLALADVERFAGAGLRELRRLPAWYALLAVSFIKETMFIPILFLLVIRLGVRLQCSFTHRWHDRRRVLMEETAVWFCVVTPFALYMLFRDRYGDFRRYEPYFGNLAQPNLWMTFGLSLLRQMGPILLPALAGWLMTIREKRFTFATATAGVFGAATVFFFMDNDYLVGLARFNLALLAPLLIASLPAITRLARCRPVWCRLFILGCLTINLFLSPVSMSGAKRPGWSAPLSMADGEYYFPFDEVTRWLHSNRPDVPILIGGAFFHNCLPWYFEEAGYHPKISYSRIRMDASPAEALMGTIRTAREHDIPLVLYHRMTGGPVLPPSEREISGYHAVHVAAGRYLAMVVYERGDASVGI